MKRWICRRIQTDITRRDSGTAWTREDGPLMSSFVLFTYLAMYNHAKSLVDMCSQDETVKEKKVKFQYIFWTTEIGKCRLFRIANEKKSIVIFKQQPRHYLPRAIQGKKPVAIFTLISEDTVLFIHGLDFQLHVVVTHHTFCLKNLFLCEELKINYSIRRERWQSYQNNTQTLLDPRSSLISTDSMITAYVYELIGVTL